LQIDPYRYAPALAVMQLVTTTALCQNHIIDSILPVFRVILPLGMIMPWLE
jgi:hypothetical protein